MKLQMALETIRLRSRWLMRNMEPIATFLSKVDYTLLDQEEEQEEKQEREKKLEKHLSHLNW